MIALYITYLEGIRRSLTTYIAYNKRQGFHVSDCVKECLCRIQVILPELRTLDSAVADDLDYYQEMRIYSTRCLEQIDLTNIQSHTYFEY